MNRNTVIKIHLALASLFLPFLLLIPLTGGLYLLGQKGEQTETEAFQIEVPVPAENQEEFFRQQFKERNIDFSFEYIRGGGGNFVFRPSSRIHYVAKKSEAGVTVFRLEPTLLKRLMEIHKGHGPTVIKYLQIAFAAAILLVTFSGIYLAATVPPYRKVMLSCFALGIFVIILGLV